MATGFLAEGVCFETLQDATDSHFSGIPVATIVTATSTLQNSYFKAGTVWGYQQKSISPTGVITPVFSITAPVPAFPACFAPSEQYNDGLSFGFLIVSLMVTPWLLSQLKKAFF